MRWAHQSCTSLDDLFNINFKYFLWYSILFDFLFDLFDFNFSVWSGDNGRPKDGRMLLVRVCITGVHHFLAYPPTLFFFRKAARVERLATKIEHLALKSVHFASHEKVLSSPHIGSKTSGICRSRRARKPGTSKRGYCATDKVRSVQACVKFCTNRSYCMPLCIARQGACSFVFDRRGGRTPWMEEVERWPGGSHGEAHLTWPWVSPMLYVKLSERKLKPFGFFDSFMSSWFTGHACTWFAFSQSYVAERTKHEYVNFFFPMLLEQSLHYSYYEIYVAGFNLDLRLQFLTSSIVQRNTQWTLPKFDKDSC